jgi:hypothetical protein
MSCIARARRGVRDVACRNCIAVFFGAHDVPFLTPYEALSILPVAFLLGFSFNPVEFRWAFHHGFESMPKEVRDRAETIRRYASFLMDTLILGLVAALMRRNLVPAARVGMHLDKWATNAVIGIASGMLLIVSQGLLTRFFPLGTSKNPFTDRVRQGSVLLWVVIFFVGVFSEELWIAFCLLTLRATGHSTVLSIAMTMIVFAAVHYGYRLGGAFAVALKGPFQPSFFFGPGL